MNCTETIKTESLKKQLQYKEPFDIECRDSQVLVFKSTDYSPACINVESRKKLVERGWAVHPTSGKAFDDSSKRFTVIHEPLKYHMFYTLNTGKIVDIELSCQEPSVLIYMNGTDSGTLDISIPPKMINVVSQVFVDNKQIIDDTVNISKGVISIQFSENAETIKLMGIFNLSTDPNKDGVCDSVQFPPYSYILKND